MSWRARIAQLMGAGLFIGHAALLPALLEHCGPTELAVRVSAPASAPVLTVKADMTEDVFERAVLLIDGQPGKLAEATTGPGAHRVQWKIAYRGGFERRVGVTQLVGPFQDPSNAPCSVRLLVGQRLLDDGAAGPGTIAGIARTIITKQLAGMSQWPIGRFTQVKSIHLNWSDKPRAWSDKPLPALRVEVTVSFTKGDVPLVLSLVPRLSDGVLTMKAYARADVDLDNRVYQWIADLFDADMIAGATAEEEVMYALKNAFRPPPPVPLPGGRNLTFHYCPHQDLEIVDGKYAAIPLQLRIDGVLPELLPVSFGPVMKPPPVTVAAPLTLEFNLDAINAMLYYMWRSGLLDDEAKRARIVERFNTEPAVQDLLSVRVGELSLPLPPSIEPGPPGGPDFELSAEAALTFADGAARTPGRAFGTIGLDFTTDSTAEAAGRTGGVQAALTLRDLEVTCHPEPDLLRPCYSDLVGALSARSDELHGELTRQFTKTFNKIVLGRRIGSDATLADFVIDRASVRALPAGHTALVRVALFGALTTLDK